MKLRPVSQWRWERIIGWFVLVVFGAFVVYEFLYIVIATLVAAL